MARDSQVNPHLLLVPTALIIGTCPPLTIVILQVVTKGMIILNFIVKTAWILICLIWRCFVGEINKQKERRQDNLREDMVKNYGFGILKRQQKMASVLKTRLRNHGNFCPYKK